MHIKILHEDEAVLVIYKPAGFAVQTAQLGQADCVSELKNYLNGRRQGSKPAGKAKHQEPYLGVVHRLDQPVEGILVFAKTKEAAALLSAQAADGRMAKRYYALVLDEDAKLSREEYSCWNSMEDYLMKDGKTGTARVAPQSEPGAKKACLRFRRISDKSLSCGQERLYLLEIELITGRFHQIRAQLAAHGMPLLGDNKYAGQACRTVSGRLGLRSAALCAYHLEFLHPGTGTKEVWECIPRNPLLQDQDEAGEGND